MRSDGGGSGAARTRSAGTSTTRGPAGVRDRHPVALDPRGGARARDPGRDEDRPEVAGAALHDPVDAGAQPEAHAVAVLGRPAVLGQSRERGAHTLELAERAADLVDEVRGVRAEPAAALRGVGPPVGHLGPGMREQRHVQQEGRHARLADRAVTHDAAQELLARRPAELGAEEVHDPGRLRGVEHHPRFGGVAREGLLAQHVLPGSDGLEREQGVRVGRGGDRDRVHRGIGERLGQARGRVRDAEARRPLGRLLRVTSDEVRHVEPRGAQPAGMRQAPEPGPDDGYPELLSHGRHASTRLPPFGLDSTAHCIGRGDHG